MFNELTKLKERKKKKQGKFKSNYLSSSKNLLEENVCV